MVEKAVGIVDVLNGFGRKSAPTQTHEIDSGVADWLFSGENIRWNVLRSAAAALNHHERTDAAELVNQNGSGNDGKVIDNDLAGEFRRVADDATVANNAVVGDVHIFHQQVVGTHQSNPFRGRSTRNRYVFADGIVVTNLTSRNFTFEFQVLRLGRKTCARKNLVVRADSRTLIDGDAVLKHVVVANDDIAVDVAKRTDDVARTELRLGMDKC